MAQIKELVRVTFQCQASLIPRDSAEGEVALTQYGVASLAEARVDRDLGQLAPASPVSGTIPEPGPLGDLVRGSVRKA